MDIIRSMQNDKVKYIRALTTAPGRRKAGETLAEGDKLVHEALRRARVRVVVRRESAPVLPDVTPLHHSCTGRVHTFILKCGAAAAEQAARACEPVFYDILPLTLEEIFIYELGGADYAVKELVL